MIVLSTYAEVDYALKLFEDGCDSRGYLLKDRIRELGDPGHVIPRVKAALVYLADRRTHWTPAAS